MYNLFFLPQTSITTFSLCVQEIVLSLVIIQINCELCKYMY